MFQTINLRFGQNLDRVKNLLHIYQTHLHRPGQGRLSAMQSDVLRAALVLLHASMEDFLRSLLVWKLPLAAADRIDTIPLYDPNIAKKAASKFLLGELVPHRGMSVDELIKKSVESHLERFQSFNAFNEVANALADCGLHHNGADVVAISEMIGRRHNIVHKADRNEVVGGQGNHRVKSLTANKLRSFISAVEGLRAVVVAQNPH